MMLLTFFIIIAYLLGSLSSAIIVCKLARLPDPRGEGSGNPGATNVLRIGGKKLAVVVLLGDAIKGVIPVVVAKLIGLPDAYLGWIGFAAFIGHLYPIFFRFQGGKGVATGLGVLIALNWSMGLAVAGTWLVVALVSRYSSLAGLVTFILAPVYCFFMGPLDYLIPVILLSIILLVRHAGNIKRLLAGKETKIGEKKST